MEWKINGAAGFATLDFILQTDEVVRSQPRAMVAMTTGIEITSAIGGDLGKGGALAGIKGLLAGESFANARFRSKRDGEALTLAPDAIGPILPIELQTGADLLIAKGSYLACESTVSLNAQYGGVKSFLAKKGLFLLRASGSGYVFLTGCGEIREIFLGKEDRIAIDNDYVVAFDSTVKYSVVTAARGIKDSVLSGEGIINRYVGEGKIYYQTRTKSRPGIASTFINTMT